MNVFKVIYRIFVKYVREFFLEYSRIDFIYCHMTGPPVKIENGPNVNNIDR